MLSKANLLDERWIVFRNRVNPTEFYRRLSCCLIGLLLIASLLVVGILSVLYKNFSGETEVRMTESAGFMSKNYLFSPKKSMQNKTLPLADRNSKRNGRTSTAAFSSAGIGNTLPEKNKNFTLLDNNNEKIIYVNNETNKIGLFDIQTVINSTRKDENTVTVEVSKDCPEFFWGSNCKHVCDCSGSKCDPVNGTCFCALGKTGLRCMEDCPKNTWGVGCKPCNCTADQLCDKVTGKCSCVQGKKGPRCDIPDSPVRPPTRGDLSPESQSNNTANLN